MKKIVATLSLILALAFASQAMAETKAQPTKAPKKWGRKYGMAGCGLGSIVMGKKGNQVFAATTNATFYSQWFGITFGTVNCIDPPANAEMAGVMDHFVAANKGSIASDIARGQGETLGSLMALMGCASSEAEFGATLKNNFGEIFPNAGVSPNEVTDSIISVIINNTKLSGSCKKIA